MMKIKQRIDAPQVISPSHDENFPAYKLRIHYDNETKPINYLVIVLVKDIYDENSNYEMIVQLPYTNKIGKKYEAIKKALIESPVAIATVTFKFNKIIRYSFEAVEPAMQTIYFATAYDVNLCK